MQIAKNKVVSIDYTLTNNQGQVLDSSEGKQPLSYIHGSGGIIPGLESALADKSPGHNFKISIPPEQAYGAQGSPPSIGPNETLIFVVDLKKAG